MFKCQYCEKICKNHNSWINHERLCKSNPKKQQSHLPNVINTKEECCYCKKQFTINNLKRHKEACHENPKNIKKCPVCNQQKYFKGVTCSHSCANTMFGHANKGGRRHRSLKSLQDAGRYRIIFQRYHKARECLVCGEDKIVEVHHVNRDHSDHRPENLAPLCPTHHMYMHGKHSYLIESKVNAYVKKFIDEEYDANQENFLDDYSYPGGFSNIITTPWQQKLA